MIGQGKNMPPKYLSNLQLFKTPKRPLTTFSSTVSQNFSDEICQPPGLTSLLLSAMIMETPD